MDDVSEERGMAREIGSLEDEDDDEEERGYDEIRADEEAVEVVVLQRFIATEVGSVVRWVVGTAVGAIVAAIWRALE